MCDLWTSVTQQDLPQTLRPSEQVIAPLPVEHVIEQAVVVAHVATQSVSHLMLQLAVPSQAMVPELVRLNLQTAESLQVAVEPAPALKSQFDCAPQRIWLPGPPLPLHDDLSSQVSASAPSVLPLHFAPTVQLTEHAAAPHCTLQSAPATQLQALSAHVQPAPLQVGAGPLPQASRPRTAAIATTVPNRLMIMAASRGESHSPSLRTARAKPSAWPAKLSKSGAAFGRLRPLWYTGLYRMRQCRRSPRCGRRCAALL